jgi:hypothetical protein
VKFKVEPRDVPAAQAARRLGLSPPDFSAALPRLRDRGFPMADPDTGNYDLTAIDRWCDLRHHHLLPAEARQIGARDAADVFGDRLAALKAGNVPQNRQALPSKAQ